MNPRENENICSSAEEALRWGGNYIENVPGLIRKIIINRAWEAREVKHEGIVKLNSLQELITEKPLRGWGTTVEKIQSLIGDDPELLVMFREALKNKTGPKAEDSLNNIVTKTITGNTKAYTLTRLSKEAPELYERVKAGGLSANAAAIEAGFRKKPSPLETVIRGYNKLTDEDKREFFKMVNIKHG